MGGPDAAAAGPEEHALLKDEGNAHLKGAPSCPAVPHTLVSKPGGVGVVGLEVVLRSWWFCMHACSLHGGLLPPLPLSASLVQWRGQPNRARIHAPSTTLAPLSLSRCHLHSFMQWAHARPDPAVRSCHALRSSGTPPACILTLVLWCLCTAAAGLRLPSYRPATPPAPPHAQASALPRPWRLTPRPLRCTRAPSTSQTAPWPTSSSRSTAARWPTPRAPLSWTPSTSRHVVAGRPHLSGLPVCCFSRSRPFKGLLLPSHHHHHHHLLHVRLPQNVGMLESAQAIFLPCPCCPFPMHRLCSAPLRPPHPPLLRAQAYYRRGDANFALGKCKLALKDLRTVGGPGQG